MDPYRIREATPGDLDVILRHRRSMFERMGYADERVLAEVLAASTPLIRRGLADGSYRGWLVEAGGGPGEAAPGGAGGAPGGGARVVAGGGVMTLEFQAHPIDPRPRRAWVVNMFTEPEHRRRGLARRLMEAMIAWCRGQGMRVLFLHASVEGRPLYESMGFVANNEMRLAL